MTPSEIVTTTTETARMLSTDTASRTFVKSIATIVDAFAEVPDCPYSAFSREQIAQVQLTAEQTIAAIERRLEGGADTRSVQLKLAEAIYAVRRELEDINRWQGHFDRT
jgi:hypothetical protein